MHTFRYLPFLTETILALALIGCGQSDSLSGGSSLIGASQTVSTPASPPTAPPPAKPIDRPGDEDESDSDKDSLYSTGNNCFSRSTNSTVTKIELKAARVDLQPLAGSKRFAWMANATFDYVQLAEQLNSALAQSMVPNDTYGTIHIAITSLVATVVSEGGTKTERIPVQFTGEGFVVHIRKPGLLVSKGKPQGLLDIPVCGNVHVAKEGSTFQIGADIHFYGQSIRK